MCVRRLDGFVWSAAAFWTGIVFAALAWEWMESRKHAEDLASRETRFSIQKNLVHRRRATTHGPAVTLVNPACMTRQVHVLGQAQERGRELKREINSLSARLGEPPRYPNETG